MDRQQKYSEELLENAKALVDYLQQHECSVWDQNLDLNCGDKYEKVFPQINQIQNQSDYVICVHEHISEEYKEEIMVYSVTARRHRANKIIFIADDTNMLGDNDNDDKDMKAIFNALSFYKLVCTAEARWMEGILRPLKSSFVGKIWTT